jgi:3-oxoacyl-[acyl-carrier protein] reductase
MTKPLEGKVAIITGGARRIGRAMALALAQDGARIVVNTKSARAEAEETAKAVETVGSKALVHIISNLLSNAVKYSDDGGVVVVGSSCRVIHECASSATFASLSRSSRPKELLDFQASPSW